MNIVVAVVLFVAAANFVMGYAVALHHGWRPVPRQQAIVNARRRAYESRVVREPQEPSSCDAVLEHADGDPPVHPEDSDTHAATDPTTELDTAAWHTTDESPPGDAEIAETALYDETAIAGPSLADPIEDRPQANPLPADIVDRFTEMQTIVGGLIESLRDFPVQSAERKMDALLSVAVNAAKLLEQFDELRVEDAEPGQSDITIGAARDQINRINEVLGAISNSDDPSTQEIADLVTELQLLSSVSVSVQ